MREIKFRAWDIEYKKMRGVMALNWFNNGVFRVNATEKDTNYEPLLYMPNYKGKKLKQFELMQYTGFKDKNGKEIYEGDIVDCVRESDTLWGEMVVVEDIRELPRALFGSNLVSREVIGNIYENPDILA